MRSLFFFENVQWKITEDKSGNLWLKNYLTIKNGNNEL